MNYNYLRTLLVVSVNVENPGKVQEVEAELLEEKLPKVLIILGKQK